MLTLGSRITGFARIAITAAVLGPTYLGNTFQAVNTLPNMIVYQLLMGSLFVSLLVPSLVRHVDAENRGGVERVAGAFLGLVTAAFGVVTVLAVAAGPLLLQAFTLGVEDPAVRTAQRDVGMLFLVMTLPQTVCYGVIATATAVLNAYGRFKLAAAAPSLENLGTIATLLATAVLFGTDQRLEAVPTGEVLLLGLGSTASVALHALVLVWGVRRLGVSLRPRAGWREPDLRELLRRVRPSFWFAGLDTLRALVIVGVVNRVAGGVIAFQLGMNLTFLVLALCTTPVGTALLPQLSRLHLAGRLTQFRDDLVHGTNLVYFLVIPAVAIYVAFPHLLAGAVSFGQMATAAGLIMVAVSVATMAPGMLGDAAFYLAYQASYARHDARTPLSSQLRGTAVAFVGVLVALFVPPGVLVLAVLGLAISAGHLVSGWDLARRVHRTLPATTERARPALARTILCSALAVGPAHVVVSTVDAIAQGPLGPTVQAIVAVVITLAVYLTLQRLGRSPELRELTTALRR